LCNAFGRKACLNPTLGVGPLKESAVGRRPWHRTDQARADAAYTSLHDRLTAVLASLEPTAQVTRELSTLMTMVTLQSVTHALETELTSTEFVVLPIFGRDGQPEYQIEIHLGGRDELTLPDLDAALRHAQTLLRPGVA